jgi:hypothetical protein
MTGERITENKQMMVEEEKNGCAVGTPLREESS